MQQQVQLFQPAGLKAIVEHQPIQQVAQNAQHNIQVEPLAVGRTVYLKVEGLLNKCEPRFRGYYTMDSQMVNGN